MSPQYLLTTILVCSLALGELSAAKPPRYRPRRLACCVGYTRQPLDIKTIKGVTIQDSRGPCRLSAVIFHTTGIDVCASAQHQWVKKVLEKLSIQIKALSKTLEKHNFLDKNALAAIVEIPSNSTNTTLMDAYGGLQ